MSMGPVHDDFEQLRRLLALKRHEQPPPGYFYGFSRQVIVRIKAGELGNESEASTWSFGTGSLFQRIWATLDARPILAGAFGVAVCGFFVVGALLSDSTSADSTPLPVPPKEYTTHVPSGPLWEQTEAKTEFSSSIVGQPNYQPPAGSLFGEIQQRQQARQIPVSFHLMGESN
jgi:hypothetical protein